jgi:DNA repair protein RadA/Sms
MATYLAEKERKKIFYFTGEESKYQTKLRANRLSQGESNVYVMHTKNIEDIERFCSEENPDLIIIDSIQTTGDPTIKSEPGSSTQVRSATGRLMSIAKKQNVTTFIIGQVNKDSGIAGPNTLKHMVDTVLYLEGDEFNNLRILRGMKNRFGSILEMGVFKMEGNGLIEIPNPSEYLLANRMKSASGSAIVCISDTRPLLIEVQALVSPPLTEGINPARTTHGFGRDRLKILVAVMQKKLRMNKLAYKDIFLNVASGLKVNEPGADLGVLLSLYSSDIDEPIDQNPDELTMILGEVGLPGEVRPVANADQLVKEAAKVGFTSCILPLKNYEQLKDKVKGIKLHSVQTIEDAVNVIWGKR